MKHLCPLCMGTQFFFLNDEDLDLMQITVMAKSMFSSNYERLTIATRRLVKIIKPDGLRQHLQHGCISLCSPWDRHYAFAIALLREDLSRIGRGNRRQLTVYEEAEHARPVGITALNLAPCLKLFKLIRATLSGFVNPVRSLPLEYRRVACFAGDISFRALHRAECS